MKKWFGVDLAVICGFAVIGRMNHSEAMTVAGWWHTAWPFLLGALLGWVGVTLARTSAASVPAGVAIWLSTVAGGMLLRQLSNQGTAGAFIVVAAIALGLGLVGPRIVVRVMGTPHRGSADLA